MTLNEKAEIAMETKKIYPFTDWGFDGNRMIISCARKKCVQVKRYLRTLLNEKKEKAFYEKFSVEF
jgi:hypothetical protein